MHTLVLLALLLSASFQAPPPAGALGGHVPPTSPKTCSESGPTALCATPAHVPPVVKR